LAEYMQIGRISNIPFPLSAGLREIRLKNKDLSRI